MKILMFGWEYSPQHTGGLGVACKELSEELGKRHEIKFVLPKADEETKEQSNEIRISDVSEVKYEKVDWTFEEQQVEYLDIETNLLPYLPPEIFTNKRTETIKKPVKKVTTEVLKSIEVTGEYNKNLTAEVTKYTLLASSLYENENFDIIHAHDWMGANAGMLAKAILKIPLVVHVHSTEYDRNGIGGNQNIKDLEKKAFETADAILSVSEKTKNDIIRYYHIDAEKIHVIPNATRWRMSKPMISQHEEVKIGFMGRFTHQKGPEKFVDLARSLNSSGADLQYVMMGDGYLEDHIKDKVESTNMSSRFSLTGFLDQQKLKKTLSSLSLIVIPSVSEPFGLVALEATARGIPVVISENAGVNEFIAFKTFRNWDIFGMNSLVLSILDSKPAADAYVLSCQNAMKKHLSWKKSAEKIEKIYSGLINP
ncbi:MAG: glycosyltransferase family 4 protein [Bacteroidota bacterium]